MTRVGSPKVTLHPPQTVGLDAGSRAPGWVAAGRGQDLAATRITMKSIALPVGNAFGVDDIESRTHYVEDPAKMLFFGWVNLTEHKWVVLRERRGWRMVFLRSFAAFGLE